MLDVSAEEFRRSRNRQEQAAKSIQDPSARRLLLFYAVECGGKYQLLVNEKCHLFTKLSEDDQGIGHDILSLLKRIGLEQKCNDFPTLHSVHQNQTISVSKYQEMWRYGIGCCESAQEGQRVEDSLTKVLSLLHDNENRR